MLRRLVSLALSVLLIGLLSVAAAAALVPAMTGTRVITIDANSMQAVLPMGSVAYIRAQPAYQIGDWVTYRNNGNVITHAIVGYGINPANGRTTTEIYQTKGTTNREDDPYTITPDQVIGRVVYHAPYVGTALQILGATQIQLFIGLLALTLWLASSPPTWLAHTPKRRNPDEQSAL